MVALALLAAALVAGAAIAQAITKGSLEAIWTVRWIPAVLVAALGRRRMAGDCQRWVHRRSGS
jgi:hypothetical protein